MRAAEYLFGNVACRHFKSLPPVLFALSWLRVHEACLSGDLVHFYVMVILLWLCKMARYIWNKERGTKRDRCKYVLL